MKSKSLQKLTKSEQKFQKVLSLESISPADLKGFSEQEVFQFMNLLNEKINSLNGPELDKFYCRIWGFMNEENRNIRWEYNQIVITKAISFLMQEFHRIPTHSEIADKSGLSRQTVQKHLKEYSGNIYYSEYTDRLSFLAPKVLARVFDYAVNGDTKAAKLFLQATGYLNSGISSVRNIQTQNNFIQLNNTIFNQEKISKLTTEQVKKIESLMNDFLNEPLN